MAANFQVSLGEGTVRDLNSLPPPVRKEILREIEQYLTREPYKLFGTRIKKMHHLRIPLYRLRVGDYRVYYRIQSDRVVVLAISNRKGSDRWLAKA